MQSTQSTLPVQIHLDPSVWTYRKNISEPIAEDTEFFTYIWRLFIAIITCAIWIEGLPQKRIYHEITETFTYNGAGSAQMERELVLAYLTAHFGYPRVQLQITGNLAQFVIVGKRTTVNWVEPHRLQISYNNTVIFDRQRQITSTLTNEEDDILGSVNLYHPEEINYTTMMRSNTEFVLCQDSLKGKDEFQASNPAIVRCQQLSEACKWLGIEQAVALATDIDVHLNGLFHFYPPSTKPGAFKNSDALNNVAHAGRWVVRLKEAANGTKSMEIVLKVVGLVGLQGDIHLDDMNSENRGRATIRPIIDREHSEIGYTICSN